MRKAKPFIKWVGGKGQLIEQLEAQLPADFDNWEDVHISSLSLAEEQCSSICCKNTEILPMPSSTILIRN